MCFEINGLKYLQVTILRFLPRTPSVKKSQNIMKILVDLILVNYELDRLLPKIKIKKVIRLMKDESLHKK